MSHGGSFTTQSIYQEAGAEEKLEGGRRNSIKKCQHKEEMKPNQYSNYMQVSILLCYCVTILKSPNYAHKNLGYAYICMKVFSFSMSEIDKPG